MHQRVDQSIGVDVHPSPGLAMRALSGMRRSSLCLNVVAVARVSVLDPVGADNACICVLSRICCTVNRALATASARGDGVDTSNQAAHSALSRSPVPVNGTSIVGSPYAHVLIPPSSVQELATQTRISGVSELTG
jgi:hypothetical protein